jgi:hypothetical protein
MRGVRSETFKLFSGIQLDLRFRILAIGGFSSKSVLKKLVAVLFAFLYFGFLSPLEAAPPTALTAPAGLAPGTHFRFIYLTSGATQATSTAIADYNSFVQSDASGSTFAGATVNWKAVASTATVNARDNVGGYGTSVPVYLVTGTRVSDNLTTSAGGLWSGTLLAAPKVGIDGTDLGFAVVWTGSSADGTAYPGRTLGDPAPRVSFSSDTLFGWIDIVAEPNVTSRKFYAVSEELVVPAAIPVPTLSQWWMLLLGLMLAGGAVVLLQRGRLAS